MRDCIYRDKMFIGKIWDCAYRVEGKCTLPDEPKVCDTSMMGSRAIDYDREGKMRVCASKDIIYVK